MLRFSFIGILTGFHWIFFFGAVKYSNASVTLVSLATTTFFTALLEPVLLKRRFEWLEIILGLIIVPAMILIVNNIEMEMRIGVVFGLISALLAASFTILNKKYIVEGTESTITFIELSAAFIFLCLLFPVFNWIEPVKVFWPGGMDWAYLLILALLCTSVAYVLALKALNHLSAFISSLTINLEPVYGIFLAMVLLREYRELNLNFYLGVLIIIIAVTLYPIILKIRKKSIEYGRNTK
jgi:drug/metabolite transporter (DMT)-like permease